MSKIKIDFDNDQYHHQTRTELLLFKAVDELKELAESVLGKDKVDNVKALIDNPTQYVTNLYWELYCDYMPAHLNKHHVIQQHTGISISMLEHLKNEINGYYSKLNKKPIINANGTQSAIKKGDYNIYLDDSKKDHYNALKDVLNSLDNLRKYTTVSTGKKLMHLIPNDLQISSSGVGIRINNFREQ